MKKVVLIGALIISTAMVHAASITWVNSGASSGLFALDGVTSITSANAGTIGLAIQLIDVTQGNAVIQSLSGSSSINNMVSGQLSGAFVSYTYGAPVTHSDQMYVLVTATFGATSYQMNIYNNNTALNYWTVGASDNTGTDTFTWLAHNYGGTGSGTGNWVAVPEPCSMALFGLGAAAIGLRRRFQKKA